jgi:hypothetical protein
LFRNQTVSLGIEKNGGRLFRRPKLTLSCSAEGGSGMIAHMLFYLGNPKFIPLPIDWLTFAQVFHGFAQFVQANPKVQSLSQRTKLPDTVTVGLLARTWAVTSRENRSI